MRRKYENAYRSFQHQGPQIFVISVFLVGIVTGSLFLNSQGQANHSMDEISNLVDGFILTINTNTIPNTHLFARSFFTYSSQVVFIWALGLFPISLPFVGLLVGAKGFSYGFTSSFFMIHYKLKGFLLSLAAYGVQGTVLVYLVFLLASKAIELGRADFGDHQKMYLRYLLVGLICAGIISLYESYLVPLLIQYIVATFF